MVFELEFQKRNRRKNKQIGDVMGMFDTFIPTETIICPKCNEEIKNAKLQSKDLQCMLDVYKQDEPLEIKRSNVTLFIKDVG